jgi:outer membrane lipoprotein SlyB
MELLQKAKNKANLAVGAVGNWYGNRNQAEKALIGAGLGSAVGTGLGAALAGKKGLRSGAILGAVGGGVGAVDWKALLESLDKAKEEYRASAASEAAATNAAKAAVTSSGAK